MTTAEIETAKGPELGSIIRISGLTDDVLDALDQAATRTSAKSRRQAIPLLLEPMDPKRWAAEIKKWATEGLVIAARSRTAPGQKIAAHVPADTKAALKEACEQLLDMNEPTLLGGILFYFSAKGRKGQVRNFAAAIEEGAALQAKRLR